MRHLTQLRYIDVVAREGQFVRRQKNFQSHLRR